MYCCTGCDKDNFATLQDTDTGNGTIDSFFLDRVDKRGEFSYLSYSPGLPEEQKDYVSPQLYQQIQKHVDSISTWWLQAYAERCFAAYNIDPAIYDPAHAGDLQQVAYIVGHQKALHEAVSKERSKLLHSSLELAINQRGIDVDTMTDLLLAVSDDISPVEFEKYRAYILSVCNKELTSLTPRVKEARTRIASGEPLSVSAQFELRSTADRYLSAIETQRRLSVTD